MERQPSISTNCTVIPTKNTFLSHFLTEIPYSIFPSRPINANKPKLIFATVKYRERNNKSITNKQKLSQTTMFWLKLPPSFYQKTMSLVLFLTGI